MSTDRYLVVEDASARVETVTIGRPSDLPAGRSAYPAPEGGYGIGWLRRTDGTYVDPNAPAPPSSDELAAYSFEAARICEQAGTVWNGWPVSTDDLAQARLQAEVIAVLLGERVDGTAFIFADQPRPLSNDDLKAVGVQVRVHVLGCIGKREVAKAGIAAGTVTSRDQVDAILAS